MITIFTGILVAISGLQLNAVDNAKYTFTINNGQLIRMNTRDGTFDTCDEKFKCGPVLVAEEKNENTTK